MELQTRLQEDMKSAMKRGEKDRLSVIRMLLSDVRNAELAATPAPAEQAVAAYAKRLRKGLEEYEKLGKSKEIEQLRFEIGVVEEYLPKKASPEETEKRVDAFLTGKSFTDKQFGQAMGRFMKQHGQEVDAGLASQVLRKRLSGQAS